MSNIIFYFLVSENKKTPKAYKMSLEIKEEKNSIRRLQNHRERKETLMIFSICTSYLLATFYLNIQLNFHLIHLFVFCEGEYGFETLKDCVPNYIQIDCFTFTYSRLQLTKFVQRNENHSNLQITFLDQMQPPVVYSLKASHVCSLL